MSKTIYYFTGTGNWLAVAKNVADQLGDSEIVNIAKLIEKEEITDRSDTVGIVFPVYFENMPDIVKSFVKKLGLEPDSYVFGVATCGSGPGFALHTLDKLLRKKGAKLSAGFEVEMPDNVVIILNLIPSVGVQESMLMSAKEKMRQIAEIVGRKGDVGIEGGKRLRDKLEGLFMKAIVTGIYRTPKRFRATSKCVKCGICRSICPTGNVEVENGKIKWGKKCMHCLACLHWCPTQAIVLGKGSADQKRYHHPEITLQDMRLR